MNGPVIVSEIPGPRSRELMNLRKEYVPRGLFEFTPIVIDEAKGPFIKDVDGNVYIDFATGIAVTNVGHVPGVVYEAITGQASRLLHTCIHVASYESYLKLAEKLVSLSPISGAAKAFFLNSGAEAVENAVKVARYFRKAIGIITFEYAFHGRTLLTMGLTSKFKPYKYGFFAFVPGVVRLPYPYPYRCPFGSKDEEECGLIALEFIERAFKTHIHPDETAAIIFEPIAGEGGYIVPPKSFVKGLRELADKYGVLLIVDEIQTGMGRTGKLFALEHFGIEADLVTLSKGMASGLPISSVVGRRDVLDSVHVGGIGGTFGGNPVSAAAALATIDLIMDSLPHAEEVGRILRKRLDELYDEYEVIGDVRGLGPMQAIELVKDRRSKAPWKSLTENIIKSALSRGLILISAGIYGNVIRLIPPINIDYDVLDRALGIFEESIRDALRNL